ncbi:uncharacterized protein FA14DRAFT_31853 [Meira miltonrushii]|uniref:NAD(P)-binding protein n=1 Tax=Meira miltonrushii TaxID=1280837 RepID=A0A316VAQ5_9BASI|nr:uncharacterized protein FA14DRAFT_31853 [Meira miltonrushii]PWN34582.1 hypothetical protein FA14DRAFT_31853 [Meira miltonrushii]
MFNVLLVGAGEINFGSTEGPWNHTARLEALLGSNLRIVGLIDPDTERAQKAINDKVRQSIEAQTAWKDTLAFKDVREAKEQLGSSVIALVVIGCPPHFRGTLEKGKNTDVEVLQFFSHAQAILVEKPVAAVDPHSHSLALISKEYEKFEGVCSIGYMLRYLKAVKKIKDTLHAKNLTPTLINGRYFMAYEYARKLSWWNSSVSCGPVVEQATHFVDLIRYFADSPVLFDTVQAHIVEHDEQAGHLSKKGFDEELIDVNDRVPRITMASWKHATGTIGSICHGISLHGTRYDTQLEVLADGWLFRLSGAYTDTPRLDIIKPGTAEIETFSEVDDPFLTEISTVVDASQHLAGHKPLSTFDDALQTYELTWAIRRAGERSSAKRRESKT